MGWTDEKVSKLKELGEKDKLPVKLLKLLVALQEMRSLAKHIDLIYLLKLNLETQFRLIKIILNFQIKR